MEIRWYEMRAEEVRTAKKVIWEKAVTSWLLLFEGDRWSSVERVALAFHDSRFAGIASLEPPTKKDGSLPTIVGIWVHPNYRGQSIGLQLIEACVLEAKNRYCAETVAIEGVSPFGLRLAQKALEQGDPLQVTGLGLVVLP